MIIFPERKDYKSDSEYQIALNYCLKSIKLHRKEHSLENPINEKEQMNKPLSPLEIFKALPIIDSNKQPTENCGYVPNLYFFNNKWHVSWIHRSEGDCLMDFYGDIPEEAIYNASKAMLNKELLN